MSPKSRRRPLLECRDLTKRYGATVALDRFTVSLPAGRIVGLLGPNGSGKTTLLKMIAGVAHPTAGDIRVAGYEVGPESKALVSYLPERPYFSRSMRVREMIAYFADFYEDFDAALARDMLARLGVPEDAPTSALSKGTVEKVQLTLVMARQRGAVSAGRAHRRRGSGGPRLHSANGHSRLSAAVVHHPFPPISYATWRRSWTTSSCCAMARCCCTRPWPT
ncbi:MAG: ATP-binding cassette domain-containing protein [Adlercreutzia equolifaciens]